MQKHSQKKSGTKSSSFVRSDFGTVFRFLKARVNRTYRASHGQTQFSGKSEREGKVCPGPASTNRKSCVKDAKPKCLAKGSEGRFFFQNLRRCGTNHFHLLILQCQGGVWALYLFKEVRGEKFWEKGRSSCIINLGLYCLSFCTFFFFEKGVFCSYLLLASLSFSENLLAHRQLFSLEVAILAPFANCRKKQWEGEKCMVRWDQK